MVFLLRPRKQRRPGPPRLAAPHLEFRCAGGRLPLPAHAGHLHPQPLYPGRLERETALPPFRGGRERGRPLRQRQPCRQPRRCGRRLHFRDHRLHPLRRGQPAAGAGSQYPAQRLDGGHRAEPLRRHRPRRGAAGNRSCGRFAPLPGYGRTADPCCGDLRRAGRGLRRTASLDPHAPHRRGDPAGVRPAEPPAFPPAPDPEKFL